MTNLEKVTNLLKQRKSISTKVDRKECIEEIVSLLGVTKGNAAVYFTKASKLIDPKPQIVSIPKTIVATEEELMLVNEKIAAIIEKANNQVFAI